MGNRTFRTIALTEAGKRAIADVPVRTWDQVLAVSKVGSCNPSDVGPRPAKG